MTPSQLNRAVGIPRVLDPIGLLAQILFAKRRPHFA
jgi:hypothetical protein